MLIFTAFIFLMQLWWRLSGFYFQIRDQQLWFISLFVFNHRNGRHGNREGNLDFIMMNTQVLNTNILMMLQTLTIKTVIATTAHSDNAINFSIKMICSSIFKQINQRKYLLCVLPLILLMTAWSDWQNLFPFACRKEKIWTGNSIWEDEPKAI